MLFSSCKQMQVTQINQNEKLSNKAGIVYYLPKTVIYLDISINRTDYLKGPFATYSSKYTGISNVITENKSEYRIEDIKITTCNIADTSKVFLITLPKSNKKTPYFEFSEDGILLSMNFNEDTINKIKSQHKNNTFNEEEYLDPSEFKYFASENIKIKTDTIFEKIILDTITIEKQILEHSVIEKSAEDKAKDVADYLKLIAEHKLNLLSGYQEVNYSLQTMEFMYEELDQMEKDYLSLFTGKKVEGTIHFRFAISPNTNIPDSGNFIFNFDQIDGLTYIQDTLNQTKNVYFKIISSQKTKILSDIQTKQNKKGLFYNVPENVRFILIKGNKEILFESSVSLSQFGKTLFMPTGINGVRFYSNSGVLRSIK